MIPSKWNPTLLSLRLFSLSKVHLRVSQAITQMGTSFYFTEWFLHMHHDLSIHLPAEGQLNCFRVLVAVNKATMDIQRQVFV